MHNANDMINADTTRRLRSIGFIPLLVITGCGHPIVGRGCQCDIRCATEWKRLPAALQVSINKALEACGLDQKLAAGRR
jgi:hypothetical protein